MGRRISRKSQQDKLERITRLQTAIASLETYQSFFERQGKLAPEDVWVARPESPTVTKSLLVLQTTG